MCDWRNPEDYTYLEDYDLHEWAWEFLRRNQTYRKAYFAYAEMATRAVLRDHEKHEELWARSAAASEPWELLLPCDPRKAYRDTRVHFRQRAGVEILNSWKAPELVPNERSKWPGYPVFLALKFNLTYSVDVLSEIAAEQLRRCVQQILEEFKDYQPLKPGGTRRFRKGNFLLYTRIH